LESVYFQNSIRHNLSLHHCFRNRKREEKGKGGYWELGVDPKKCDRKRIRNRKTGQSKLIAKNHCSLAKFQVCENIQSTANNSECSQEKHIPLCYRQHSEQIQPNHYMGADKVAQLDLIEKTRTLTEIEVGLGLGLSLPNALSPRIQEQDPDSDSRFLCPNELAMTTNAIAEGMQHQYELGTIIISTTGIMDESSCLNSIINNKFSYTNMVRYLSIYNLHSILNTTHHYLVCLLDLHRR